MCRYGQKGQWKYYGCAFSVVCVPATSSGLLTYEAVD